MRKDRKTARRIRLTRTLKVRLADELVDRVNAAAAARGETYSFIVREALRNYLAA